MVLHFSPWTGTTHARPPESDTGQQREPVAVLKAFFCFKGTAVTDKSSVILQKLHFVFLFFPFHTCGL